MHHFILFLLLVLLLPREILSGTAAAAPCNRRCGGTNVPYPFGFSGGCPIALSCDANTSTPILPYRGDNGSSYHVVSFNSTTSTVVVGLPPSCSRSVSDARRALSGANYGVSSRTGLFLHGHCSSNTSVCSVPAAVMSRLLRTAQCSNDTLATAVSCVASAAQNASVARADQFLRWEKVERQDCNDVMTSAVYMDTPEGTMSQEYAVAELRWWVNGTCAGDEAVGQCVAEATCADVGAPSGAVGHRCACVAGMNGDGFLAGDGCYVGGFPHDVASSSRERIIFIIVGSLGGFAAFAAFVFVAMYQRKRRNAMTKITKQLPKKAAILFHGQVMEDDLEQGASGPRRFSYDELAVATDNFSDGTALGRGGFGSVYKGFMSDINREVAVKRVSETSRQGWKEFVSEVRIISRLRHRNLV